MRRPAGGVVESDHPSRWIVTAIERWLYRARSPYQEIAIGEASIWGRCLFLDGWLQLAEADEYIYHEHLVLPPLLAHPHPRRVLILGGGDGLAAREVLRHRAVEQVVLVDIDGQVVDACREHLAPLQRGALDDPRTTVHIEDARRFLRRAHPAFDVVLVDLVDFTPQTQDLYTEVLHGVLSVLAEEGVVAVHGPDAYPPLHQGLYLVRFLRRLFPALVWYEGFVPSFGAPWTFAFAARQPLWPREPETWGERAEALDVPPRSLVPEALPALFRHPAAVEERIRTLPDRPREERPLWHARVLDDATFARWWNEAGFPPSPERS